MDESHMTLLKDWNGKTNLTGWHFSEKLDGCRAFWDGNALWTRDGNRIPAPQTFTRQLPAGVRLDGELWAGRDTFTIARLATQYGQWTPEIKFMVFDAPDAAGTWLGRMQAAEALLAGNGVARTVKRGVIKDFFHLCKVFFAIRGALGEGLVLRNPAFVGYERGRSKNALRIKRDPEWGY